MPAVHIEDVREVLRVLLCLGPVHTTLHAAHGPQGVDRVPQLPAAPPHPPGVLPPAGCEVREQETHGL